MNKENQQITSYQLSWLAGIWDGEGTFMIYRQEYTKRYGLTGRITLTNSSIEMINEISKIFDYYHIGGHIFQEKLRSEKHKACYHITVNKIDHVKKAIELMLPYLVAKKAHAEVLLRFINSRLKYKCKPIKDVKNGKIIGMQTQGYDKELTFWEQLKNLNSFGPQEGISQTIRQTCMTTCLNTKS